MGIPSQYVDLTNTGSPARPLNRVATVPGYRFGNTMWTTGNWQSLDNPSQQNTEAMSPEVASLLQTLGKNKPNIDTRTEPEVIELDTELTSRTDVKTVPELNCDTLSVSPVIDNTSEASEDSAMELLNELNSAMELLNELNLDVSSIKTGQTLREPNLNLKEHLSDVNHNKTPIPSPPPDCVQMNKTVITSNATFNTDNAENLLSGPIVASVPAECPTNYPA